MRNEIRSLMPAAVASFYSINDKTVRELEVELDELSEILPPAEKVDLLKAVGQSPSGASGFLAATEIPISRREVPAAMDVVPNLPPKVQSLTVVSF